MNEFIEIGGHEGANPAYIRELYLIRKSDVVEMQNPIYSPNNDGYLFSPDMITLTDSAEIFKIKFVWRTCEWVENFASKSPALYNNGIAFEISATEADARQWAIDNIEQEFIAMFGNRANQTFICGNTDVGLELNVTNKVTPKNFIGVELTGEMVVPVFQTTEFDLDSFFGVFEFSDEFNIGEEFN